jgi:hypothetical protein
MSAPKQQLPWMSIIIGERCAGHILNRGPRGWESYNADDMSLGCFPTQEQAISAVDRASAEADQ